ncbi:MAG: acyltransferase [Bradyrhizobium sp.]
MPNATLPTLSEPARNSFNAIRLLAALQVAYVHASAHLQLEKSPLEFWNFIYQFPGVPVFFAISGYLVFDSVLRLGSLRRFYLHRDARIYPALIFNIVLIEILLYAAGQSSFAREIWRVALYFIFYFVTASDSLAALWSRTGGTYNFDGFFQMYPSGVLWTLTVELTFYLVIPLFALGRTRIVQAVLIVAATGLSFAYQRRLGADLATMKGWPVSISVLPYFWMFGIGMLFRLWRPPSWMNLIAVPALIAVSTVLALNSGSFEWKVEPTAYCSLQTAVLSLLAVWLGYSPFLKNKWLARNDMSYGLYLYHMLIVTALLNVPLADRTRWLLVPVLAGGMLAGFASWWLVERPFMRLARRGEEAVPVEGSQRPQPKPAAV